MFVSKAVNMIRPPLSLQLSAIFASCKLLVNETVAPQGRGSMVIHGGKQMETSHHDAASCELMLMVALVMSKWTLMLTIIGVVVMTAMKVIGVIAVIATIVMMRDCANAGDEDDKDEKDYE